MKRTTDPLTLKTTNALAIVQLKNICVFDVLITKLNALREIAQLLFYFRGINGLLITNQSQENPGNTVYMP